MICIERKRVRLCALFFCALHNGLGIQERIPTILNYCQLNKRKRLGSCCSCLDLVFGLSLRTVTPLKDCSRSSLRLSYSLWTKTAPAFFFFFGEVDDGSLGPQ